MAKGKARGGKGTARAARVGKVLGAAVGLLLKGVATALAVATPLLGVWVASSLASYANGPLWLAALAGLLLFPLLPLGWELVASLLRRRRKVVKEHILTTSDRVILRTILSSLLFLGALLALWPEVGFTALQTRGDWMLEGVEASWAPPVRRGLFSTADRLEWLYLLSHEDEFAREDEGDGPVPTAGELPSREEPRAGGAGDGPSAVRPTTKEGPRFNQDGWADQGRVDGGSKAAPDAGAARVAEPVEPGEAAPEPPRRDGPDASRDRWGGAVDVPAWPVAATLHPVAASVPDSAEGSIESLARYIASKVPDSYGRLRVIHDWVADNVAYDVPSYRAKKIPPQDAETTFRTRKSVCAGYASLVEALGKAIGLNVAFVSGDARDETGDVSGEGHAWNAARLGGTWYLLDATWDAGYPDGDSFVKRFSTEYFLTPPEVFSLDHFPREPRWQLRNDPLGRGEFMRQPMLRPRFLAKRLRLLEPTRSQVTVAGEVRIRVENPAGLHMLASHYPAEAEGGRGTRCEVQGGREVVAVCRFPGSGRYRVRLFASAERYGSYPDVGQVLVNSTR